jgi:hypothetical protein
MIEKRMVNGWEMLRQAQHDTSSGVIPSGVEESCLLTLSYFLQAGSWGALLIGSSNPLLLHAFTRRLYA